jgi:hypothetical protein
MTILTPARRFESMASLFPTFAAECLIVDPRTWSMSSDLFERWCAWCDDKGVQSGAAETFFKTLVCWSNGAVRRQKKMVADARIPGYVGIAIAG